MSPLYSFGTSNKIPFASLSEFEAGDVCESTVAGSVEFSAVVPMIEVGEVTGGEEDSETVVAFDVGIDVAAEALTVGVTVLDTSPTSVAFAADGVVAFDEIVDVAALGGAVVCELVNGMDVDLWNGDEVDGSEASLFFFCCNCSCSNSSLRICLCSRLVSARSSLSYLTNCPSIERK